MANYLGVSNFDEIEDYIRAGGAWVNHEDYGDACFLTEEEVDQLGACFAYNPTESKPFSLAEWKREFKSLSTWYSAEKLRQLASMASDDLHYGSAANGMHVGSGWDCTIIRTSARRAIVNLCTLGRDYLGSIEVEEDDDMQNMAVRFAQLPGPSIDDMFLRPDSEDEESPYWALADEWDTLIETKPWEHHHA